MRLFTLCMFAVLAGGADFTYLGGSVSGLAPNSEGTLSYASRKIELKTPLQTVVIPYMGISKAELGEVHTPVPEPLYKVWTLHKRFSKKGETQEITVTFKEDGGRERTVTLELARQDASGLLATIQYQNATNEEWWGDKYWKTTRNAEQWSGN